MSLLCLSSLALSLVERKKNINSVLQMHVCEVIRAYFPLVSISVLTPLKKHFKYKLQILMSYTVFLCTKFITRQVDNCMECKNGTLMHTHTTVCEHADVIVTWNHGVHTDREFVENRLDVRIKNKEEKTCSLINVAISADKNVTQKEAEKILK
jgi:hypothetical protein